MKKNLTQEFEVHGLGWGHESDQVIEAFIYWLDTGTKQSIWLALVGVDLAKQKGAFYVFLPGEQKALKVPVKDVLEVTNSAGSVRVCQYMLESRVKQVLAKVLAKVLAD